METPTDSRYINARKVLLDALDALGPLRQAVILVGAQAVYAYSHAVDAEIAISPFTYDADIALNPELLSNEPRITEVMLAAGFSLTDQPGIYKKADGSQVDLLVPEGVGGPGRRGARLGIHGNRAAMKVRGLEGALVSHRPRRIHALAPGDSRSYITKVAGPAALLVAKVHKMSERIDEPVRNLTLHKDAFDVYRLLRAVEASEMALEIRHLLECEISAEVTAIALTLFGEYFGNGAAIGTRQVAVHVEGLEDTDFITASSVALSQDLLDLTS